MAKEFEQAPEPTPATPKARAAAPRKPRAPKVAAAAPAASPKNLLVQHNLSEAGLHAAHAMGGLIVPSLAVAHKDHPLVNFGEISLIAHPGLVDPKHTPVYGADVYSPRQPKAKYKPVPKEVDKVKKWLRPFVERTGNSHFNCFHNIDDNLNRGGHREALLGHPDIKDAAALAFLEEKGHKFGPPPTQDVPLRRPWVREPAMMEFFAHHGRDHNFQADGSYHVAMSAAAKEAIGQFAKRNADDPEQEKDLAEAYSHEFGEDGNLYFSTAGGLLDDHKKVGQTQVDAHAMHDLVQQKVEPYKKEFEAWAHAKAKPMEGAPYLVKDSGSKVPYNIDNVMKEMTRRIRGGEGFNYGLGSARAIGAKQFKDLDEVAAHADKIVPHEEFDKHKKANDEKLLSLAQRLAAYHPAYGDRGAFGQLDSLTTAIGNSYRRGKSLATELRLDGYQNVPPELVQELHNFTKDLQGMPTEYFEAKPQRVVGINEFKSAVVPHDASPETLKLLAHHGIKHIERYDRHAKDDQDQRRAAIQRAASEDLRLSEEDLVFPDLAKAEIEAPKVVHGQPASIPYLHRKSAVPTANFGATYGQHLEPAGKYISHHEDPSHRPETLGTGQTQSWYEYGVAHFKKPWVHKMSDSEGFIDWKSHLSEANQGKTGKALSRHLNRHGYDGVVVLDPHGSISEMVNLGAPETVTHAMRKSEAPVDCAAVLVTDGYGRILLGQRRDNGRWTMPAGHLNPGEAPEDGARRELFEEAALSPEHLTFLKVAPLHDGARLHCFTALGTGIPHSRNDPDQECEKWEWIDARGGIPANVWDNLHGPDGDRNVLRQVFDLKKAEREWLDGGFADLQKKLPAYNPDTALTPHEEEHVANWQAASDDKWTDANRPTRDNIPRMEGPARVRGLHRMTGMTQVKMGPDGKRSYLMHRAMSPTEAVGTVGDTHVKHDTRTSWSPKSGPAPGELYHVVQHFAKEYGGPTVSAWVPEDKIHAMLPMWGRTHPHAVELDQWTRENTSFDGNVKTRGPGYQARHWEVIVDPHESALATPEEQAAAFANDTDHLDTRINERGARHLPALSNYGRKFAGPSRAPEALDPAEYRSRIQKSESETCERCSEPATKRVLWAEGMAYLPACDKHIPVLKSYFGDDFSGLRDIKKAESEVAPLLSHPDPRERAMALKLDTVTPSDLGIAILDPHPGVWQAAFHHPQANLALETLASHTRDAAGAPLFERHDLLLVDPRCQQRHLEAMVRAVRGDAYLPVPVQAARLQALGAHPSADRLAKSEWAHKALSQASRSPGGQMVHADLENTPRQHGHFAEAYHEHIGGAKGMTALDGDLHSGGTTHKAVYKIPVAGHTEAQRMMVKPYHESHEPLSGWAELSSQHLYNAAGIDHLHQKSFAAQHGEGDRRVHAVVIPIEKATPVDQVPAREIHTDNPGAREDARKIAAMDFLTGNDDRHAGNLMVREDGSLMAIDHGASFRYGHSDEAEPPRNFEFYAGGGPGVVDPITSQADFGNYKNTFKWWKDVGPDVRAAFHDRLQLVKHPEVRKQLGERFEHRASWLDARASEGDKLHDGWHWRKIAWSKPEGSK